MSPQKLRHIKFATSVDPAKYTPCFSRRASAREAGRTHSKGTVFCEDVPLERIAAATGTPAYVYSRSSIEQAYQRLDRASHALPHTLCYALKANANLSILRILAKLGSGFDIVSGGELERLQRL